MPTTLGAAFDFIAADGPLLISMPHVGVALPPEVEAGLSPAARDLQDTDWHLTRLYDFAPSLGASVLSARYSRFAIDLNRPSDDKPLYQTATTGLFPDILFDGRPLFAANKTPSKAARQPYLGQIWRPYHAKIETELARIKQCHGFAILFDAHSIRGCVPRLFDGQLPDFNIGTNAGLSAAPALTARLAAICDTPGYRHVVNGRFKGGHITRHYGHPETGAHAIQLELAQRTYMREEAPFDYLEEQAAKVRPILRRFVETLLAFKPT